MVVAVVTVWVVQVTPHEIVEMVAMRNLLVPAVSSVRVVVLMVGAVVEGLHSVKPTDSCR